MNIFGFGTAELVVVVLIMLIVAGPKRMLQWSYILGKYLAKLRIMWRELMASLQEEFDEAGVGVKLPKDLPTRRDIHRLATEAVRPIQEPMDRVIKEYEAEVKQLDQKINADKEQAETAVNGIKSDIDKKLKTNGKQTSHQVFKQPPTTKKPKATPTNGFGVWSGKSLGKDAKEDDADDGFGSWSNPNTIEGQN
jgi:Sec-independent protein translocase protein TatA